MQKQAFEKDETTIWEVNNPFDAFFLRILMQKCIGIGDKL